MPDETIQVNLVTEEVVATLQNSEQVVVELQEQTIAVQLGGWQGIDVNLIEEVLQLPAVAVESAPSAQPGRNPFLEIIAVPAEDAVIDCNKSMAWRIDAAALSLAVPLQIDIINLPVNYMALLYILVANVPVGGCAVLWPAAAGVSNTPVGPGLSNEYEVRTWDGGATLHIKRSAYYRVV